MYTCSSLIVLYENNDTLLGIAIMKSARIRMHTVVVVKKKSLSGFDVTLKHV